MNNNFFYENPFVIFGVKVGDSLEKINSHQKKIHEFKNKGKDVLFSEDLLFKIVDIRNDNLDKAKTNLNDLKKLAFCTLSWFADFSDDTFKSDVACKQYQRAYNYYNNTNLENTLSKNINMITISFLCYQQTSNNTLFLEKALTYVLKVISQQWNEFEAMFKNITGEKIPFNQKYFFRAYYDYLLSMGIRDNEVNSSLCQIFQDRSDLLNYILPDFDHGIAKVKDIYNTFTAISSPEDLEELSPSNVDKYAANALKYLKASKSVSQRYKKVKNRSALVKLYILITNTNCEIIANKLIKYSGLNDLTYSQVRKLKKIHHTIRDTVLNNNSLPKLCEQEYNTLFEYEQRFDEYKFIHGLWQFISSIFILIFGIPVYSMILYCKQKEEYPFLLVPIFNVIFTWIYALIIEYIFDIDIPILKCLGIVAVLSTIVIPIKWCLQLIRRFRRN